MPRKKTAKDIYDDIPYVETQEEIEELLYSYDMGVFDDYKDAYAGYDDDYDSYGRSIY